MTELYSGAHALNTKEQKRTFTPVTPPPPPPPPKKKKKNTCQNLTNGRKCIQI